MLNERNCLASVVSWINRSYSSFCRIWIQYYDFLSS